ncbi:hypothetical protein EKH57_15185 [Halorubrum sp. BOL3-1]|uniref:hypothetical protein n=1 Tax=Halorubrum sp. BOL3-1 TaxID=2497325 RepID=UPI001004F112|nr:hypothetical protein [Halorubrum sp. BOL3-1]QAU13950.1 hypothetical protein EKH57_15185 [Halorubrum sp. BOL3-1]
MSDGDRSEGNDAPEGGDRSDDGDAPDADPFGDELFDDGPEAETDDSLDASDADDSLAAPDTDEADDPFAALDEGGVDEADSDASAHGSSRADPDVSAPADDPFAGLDADTGADATDEDPFESMEVGDVGEEDVWEALDEERSLGADATESDAGGAPGDIGEAATRPGGPGAGAATAGDERVVDKRSYCQQCPHFSAPPETACTHEGTEIVESVDFSRFRVRKCPMVDADDPAFDEE